MTPVLLINFLALIQGSKVLKERERKFGFEINSLEDYYQYMELQLEKWVKVERVIGLKTVSNPFREPPSPVKAEILFRKIGEDKYSNSDIELLRLFLLEKIYKLCNKYDVVVAVHAGVWGDFRNLDPRHMIPIFERFPETRFISYGYALG